MTPVKFTVTSKRRAPFTPFTETCLSIFLFSERWVSVCCPDSLHQKACMDPIESKIYRGTIALMFPDLIHAEACPQLIYSTFQVPIFTCLHGCICVRRFIPISLVCFGAINLWSRKGGGTNYMWRHIKINVANCKTNTKIQHRQRKQQQRKHTINKQLST